jgi:hypothetical protein
MQRKASGEVNKNVAVAVIEEAVREDMAPKIAAHSSHPKKKIGATPHTLLTHSKKQKFLTGAHYQARYDMLRARSLLGACIYYKYSHIFTLCIRHDTCIYIRTRLLVCVCIRAWRSMCIY